DLRADAGARRRIGDLAPGRGRGRDLAGRAAGLGVAGATPATRGAGLMLDIDIRLRRGRFERDVRIVEDARVLALAGPSGAGKTSVLNAIAGLVRPVSGRIVIDGRTLFDSAAGIDVPTHRRGIGCVIQDARLFLHGDGRGNQRYGRYGARRGQEILRLEAVVELLGCRALLDRRPANLSGGEHQRVAIGRVL